jgi:hypothetical protein
VAAAAQQATKKASKKIPKPAPIAAPEIAGLTIWATVKHMAEAAK